MSTTDNLSSLVDSLLRVSEQTAAAANKVVGYGDETLADQVAVDAMRSALNQVPMIGRIVIGEGERDEAPMLHVGEEVGTGSGVEVDIAVDPLEGTSVTARGMANALVVLAVSPRGGLLHAPDTYMSKIAIGSGYPSGTIDLDETPANNVRSLASAKGVSPSEICVSVLDRPRHQEVIESLRKIGARVMLVPDGDVATVIATALEDSLVDMYIGIGGAPEGVLGAAALKCLGGEMYTRLVIRNSDEEKRAKRLGIEDLNRCYSLGDLVTDEVSFIATGVTDGILVDGVSGDDNSVSTHSLVMSSANKLVRTVRSQWQISDNNVN